MPFNKNLSIDYRNLKTMKLLFLGGNRFFGKKIIFELSKNYKNKIYLINRSNKKNIKKKTFI